MIETAKCLDWTVLVIGGASGIGKSTLARTLAARFAVPLTEVDDIHTALMAFTTPKEQPLLHYWWANPDAHQMSAEQIVQHHLAVSRLLLPVLQAIIADHLESRSPVIIEGDYILPELFTLFPATDEYRQVCGLLLHEPDVGQIITNYLSREPDAGEQHGRATVSRLLGEWSERECQNAGVPCLAPRPYNTLLQRVLEAIKTT